MGRCTSTIYINDEGNSREDVYFATQGYDKSDNGIDLDGDTKIVQLHVPIGRLNADYREDRKEFIKRAIVFNLNGIAKNVIGTMDMSNKNDGMEGKVIFYDQNDRVLYETSTIRNTTTPVPFEFSVSGVLQLKAEFIASGQSIEEFSIELKDFRYSI